jgi:integrase
MSSNSNQKRRPRKAADRPKKPYPNFPLTPHASGTWQKKIRGKIYYFGRWAKRVNGKLVRIEGDGWKEALEEYKAQADDLHAGRTPRVTGDGLTVADLCNRFLTAKHRKQTSGELGTRMFQEYREITDLIVAAFGKTRLVDDLAADDFEKLRADMTERWGPVRLGNAITRVKSVFKYGIDNGLIEKAIRFGGEFKKPDKAVLRRHRAKNGTKMLEAADLRRILFALVGEQVGTTRTDKETNKPDTVTLHPNLALRAMILLGINAGFGNHDVATLPLSAADLEAGWLNFPRPKTGIARRCPLWPETVAALQAAIAQRPEPRQENATGLVFVNSRGLPWVRTTDKSRTDTISAQFAEVLKLLGLHRDGIGFYTLRHVFRTVADAARDPVAIDLIMGHTDPSMGGHYRERVEDSRLQAVVEHVRQWLFGLAPGTGLTGTMQQECAPCDPEVEGSGAQENATLLPAEGRPARRLYVG